LLFFKKTVIMRILLRTGAFQCLTWFVAVILAFTGIVSVGCGTGATGSNSRGNLPGKAGKAGRRGGPGAVSEITVQATGIRRISIQREVDIAGSLISSDQAKVSSEVAGVVQQVFVELGQEVSAGQIVVKLDPQELDLALQRAQSQLRQTEAQLGIDGVTVKEPPPDEQVSSVRLAMANRDDALAQLRRAQRLRSRNLLPQADLDTAETKVKVTEANFQTALENVQSLKAILQERRHAVELAQKKLNDTKIRSSISGQIAERMVNQGEYIRENTPVVSVVQMNPLKVETAVQERYAGLVRQGLSVEFSVESAPGRKFSAKVAHISPSVDPSTRTFAVEVLVDNSNRLLKPGFFVKGVILTHRDENVMAVPEDAISRLAGVSNVYIIEQGKIRQQAVSLGTRVGNLFEVVDGLKGDELLAASNLTMLATGVQVKVAQQVNPESRVTDDTPSAVGETRMESEQGGRP
jgi:RND family efflux transporter MFP subunit